MKRSLLKILFLTTIWVVFSCQFPLPQVKAQIVDNRWSPIQRLSSESAHASEASMVSDSYGYVHVFWTETELLNNRSTIQYSRFDGQSWISPVDIYLAPPMVVLSLFSPVVDSEGTLHLAWSQGNAGPVFYTSAPAHHANTAQNWARVSRVDIPAYAGRLRVDSEGTLHIVYVNFYGNEPGVYYVRSVDEGLLWSSPVQLDSNVPEGYSPPLVQFEINEDDELHAVWYYRNVTIPSAPGNFIRYSHSFDKGETWSPPFTIDEADENPEELRLPHPSMIVQGKNVHVIWAGDAGVHREHRYSTNGGNTWSPTRRVWGELQGQALGGGLATDARGRIHYVDQVRWPQGIYHAFWERSSWSIPELFYLIARDAGDDIGDRVHAHNVRLAIRAGNQLVVTFTTSPSDPQYILYTTYRTLDDVQPLPTQALPVSVPTPAAEMTPVLEPATPTPQQVAIDLGDLSQSRSDISGPAAGLIWGIIPSLILLAGVAIFQILMRR